MLGNGPAQLHEGRENLSLNFLSQEAADGVSNKTKPRHFVLQVAEVF